MTGRLVINGIDMDLKPDTVIAITLQVNDIASVDDRQSNFSNTFKLPATQHNIEALGFSTNMAAQSTVPYTKMVAQYYQNGVQVIKNGFAILEQSGDDIEVTLYDGNVSFFDLIAGLKLSDLEGLTDVIWTLDNAVASRTATSDYIWAVIDWFESMDDTTREYDVSIAHPCYFLKDVMAAIFEPTGYTLKGLFVEGVSAYSKLIVPLITNKQDPRYFKSKATVSTDQPSDLAGSYVMFQNILSDPIATAGAGSLWEAIGPEWRFFDSYGSGKYSFRFMINWGTAGDTGYIEIHATGTPIVLRRDDIAASSTGTIEFELRDVELTHPAVVGIFFKSNGTDPVSILEGTWMECFTAAVETDYEMLFPIAVNLPAFDQKTFIKALMQKYCIVPITNSFRKEVTFVQLSELILNKAQARDWTSKVHMGQRAKIGFVEGNYGQVNYLRYAEDETVREEYGDGGFRIANETLPLSKTVIALPYAATEMNVKMGGVVVPEIKDGAKPRILILEPAELTDGDLDWTDGTDTDTPGGDEPLAYFALKDKPYNLKFSDDLITEHYTDLVSMLQSFKKVTVLMRLTAIDIEKAFKDDDNDDALIPIYLRQFGAYFYLNKISQWVSDSTLCEVELVRLGIAGAPQYLLTDSGIIIETDGGDGILV